MATKSIQFTPLICPGGNVMTPHLVIPYQRTYTFLNAFKSFTAPNFWPFPLLRDLEGRQGLRQLFLMVSWDIRV